MNEEKEKPLPEDASAEPKPAQSEPTSQPDLEPAPVIMGKPQLGRLRRFWRATLIWLVVFAVVFLAGVLTYHFLRYKPLTETLTQTQGELAQANQTIGDLQAEIEKLNGKLTAANDKIAALENDKQIIQAELEDANAHLELLQVLVDVNAARLALFLGDVPGAQLALADTLQRLEALAERLAEADPNLAQSMPQRLNLILSSLAGGDVTTANIDLELFTKNLLDVETALFGE
ncbi:MAG: hypothetical protein KKC71_10190 [Chloroflexi bacterium]|nr:hypothetical protein [Chloroflexota bacterium]